MSFYVTLPSNTFSTRENFTGNFRVHLAHALEFEGDWEVGLASIQYPYTWDNFVNQSFTIYFENSYLTVKVPDAYYDSIEDLVSAMNSSYHDAVTANAKTLGATENKGFSEFVKTYSKAVNFAYNNVVKRVAITVNQVKAVYLNEHLQYTLGFPKKMLSNFTNLYRAEYPPDFTAGLTSLFIYTDIIRPQLVGNVEVPLLRVIPIKGKYGENIVKDYDSLHYVDLLNKRFDSISIAIKDDSDTPVKFLYGKAVLKLHFRKKRFF